MQVFGHTVRTDATSWKSYEWLTLPCQVFVSQDLYEGPYGSISYSIVRTELHKSEIVDLTSVTKSEDMRKPRAIDTVCDCSSVRDDVRDIAPSSAAQPVDRERFLYLSFLPSS